MLVCVSVISVATASHGSEEHRSKYTKETTITSVNLINEIFTVIYMKLFYKDIMNKKLKMLLIKLEHRLM